MIQHLSIRVPWHDHGWDGTICQDPCGNTACLKLNGILEGKKKMLSRRYADSALQDMRMIFRVLVKVLPLCRVNNS